MKPPGPILARSLFAQPGHVVEMDGQWRWNGEEWLPLQPGDICRHGQTGASLLWTGQEWKLPTWSKSDRDELAAVIDPEAFSGQDTEDATHWEIRRALARESARRALVHGYVLSTRLAALEPVVYHTKGLGYEVGDRVDVTWSNGRRTRHEVIEIVDGRPVLLALEP